MTNERREEETETIEIRERRGRDFDAGRTVARGETKRGELGKGSRSTRDNFALKITVFTRRYWASIYTNMHPSGEEKRCDTKESE